MSVQRVCLPMMLLGCLIVSTLALASPRGTGDGEAPPVLHEGDIPIGSLGHPIGDYLTVEGTRWDGPKSGVSTLRVDTVNGRKLPEAIGIWVDDLELPQGRRCTIKGYETVEMWGKAPARLAAEEEAGQSGRIPQKRWGVHLKFIALRVVAPAGLRPSERP